MAPLCIALQAESTSFTTRICVTGQHRKMLDQVLDTFHIKPDIDLNLMKASQSLEKMTADILTKVSDILRTEKPDLVLVHGDTTTAFASALAAFYQNIPVAHVEAGLRTFNIRSPFPEEFNRQAVQKLTDLHFAPTETAKSNLQAENVSDENIFVTGNTVIDALHFITKAIEEKSDLQKDVYNVINDALPFEWMEKKFVLITGHRRENFGSGFEQICNSINLLSKLYTDVHFVYPVHLNPQVMRPVNTLLAGLPNVHLIHPLEYQPFVLVLKHCYLVLTDSGGIQEEAPSFGKPVLLMRETTERPEAVKHGTVRLVGANCDKIVDQVSEILENEDVYSMMSRAINPYGDGKSAEKIVTILKDHYAN